MDEPASPDRPVLTCFVLFFLLPGGFESEEEEEEEDGAGQTCGECDGALERLTLER